MVRALFGSICPRNMEQHEVFLISERSILGFSVTVVSIANLACTFPISISVFSDIGILHPIFFRNSYTFLIIFELYNALDISIDSKARVGLCFVSELSRWGTTQWESGLSPWFWWSMWSCLARSFEPIHHKNVIFYQCICIYIYCIYRVFFVFLAASGYTSGSKHECEKSQI